MSTVHRGNCFCSAVRIELSGEPAGMGYCHCSSCRLWSGDPVHAWTVWPADSLKITKGSECIGTIHRTPDSLSHRQFCTQCGGHLMISHPTMGIFDVLAGVVQNLTFVPTMHLNYAESVLTIEDDLPKYKDFPAEFSAFGGSGELVSG